ncbi:MAG: SGNH/GDSL hydrolase family protein [Phycisphaeraceae bacterium]
MPTTPKQLTTLLLACLLLTGCNSDYIIRSTDYRSPDRFEREIQKFEKADAKAMPPKDAVLCVGSSSIRMWHGSLAEDLEPLTVIGRGFGGSNTNDLLYYADRIVINYKPRAVMIYEGDNDIAQGVKPVAIVATHKQLLNKIKRDLPGCRVYILAVKPSPKRWKFWAKMQSVNESLAELADERDNVTFIDIASPMIGRDGQPRAELYIKDDLHLSQAGYKLWRDTVRPILVEAERKHEQPRASE